MLRSKKGKHFNNSFHRKLFELELMIQGFFSFYRIYIELKPFQISKPEPLFGFKITSAVSLVRSENTYQPRWELIIVIDPETSDYILHHEAVYPPLKENENDLLQKFKATFTG